MKSLRHKKSVDVDSSFAEQNCYLDLCFLIDSSGSIQFAGPDNWGIILAFVNQVIGSLTVGPSATQVGMVVFSTDAEKAFGLTDYRTVPDLQSAINRTAYRGGQTNLYDALNVAANDVFASGNGRRPNAAQVIIIVTDGMDTYRPGDTVAEAQTIKNTGITILTVGVTNQINVTKLQQIASSQQYYFNVTDYRNLNTLLTNILIAICPVSTSSSTTRTTSTTTTTAATTTLPGGSLALNNLRPFRMRIQTENGNASVIGSIN